MEKFKLDTNTGNLRRQGRTLLALAGLVEYVFEQWEGCEFELADAIHNFAEGTGALNARGLRPLLLGMLDGVEEVVQEWREEVEEANDNPPLLTHPDLPPPGHRRGPCHEDTCHSGQKGLQL